MQPRKLDLLFLCIVVNRMIDYEETGENGLQISMVSWFTLN